jgi:hypothetical protein
MTIKPDKASVIDYWRAVELFSPQSVPRPAPNDNQEPVFSVKKDLPLPWDISHSFRSRTTPPNKSRRYSAYCGIFSLEKVRSILEKKFGKDSETFDERSDGETCLFAVSVTDDGRPLFDTFTLSTCAWATARTLKPGPDSSDWLVGFETMAKNVVSGFAEKYAILQNNEQDRELKGKGFNLGRSLTYTDVFNETKHIAEELGIACLFEDFEIRIKAGLVAVSKEYTSDDQDFLNSFYVRDLAKVAVEVSNSNFGKGLSTFLAGTDEVDSSQRIDVRKSIDILFQQLSPSLFSSGRWPSKSDHSLAFSQQFAVNSMVQELMKGSGLFAVNGPPGTGKTTLVRDLISAVVVERAKRISKLANPGDAFIGQKRWKVNNYTRVISIWKEELRGFEIVIASNNNGAVENVTMEIPGIDAIDPFWTTKINYFPELATRLIGGRRPAWAMIAARLGNKTNRAEFINRFWYGNEEADDHNDEDSSSAGFLNLLKSFEDEPVNWGQAVSSFNKALMDEQYLRKEREDCFFTHMEFFVEEAKECRLDHRKFRPGIIEILFSLGKAYHEWRKKDKLLEASIERAEHQLTEARKQTTSRKQVVQSIANKVQPATLGLNLKRKSLIECREQLNSAKDRFGSFYPELGEWVEEEEARELSTPWADPEWNNARAKVFLEALQLHKVFITGNAEKIRKNLQGTMDILSDTIPDTALREAVEAAWTTLFFVIPVISTTFASFDRLFSHLGRESIGWLLIDEAGQALPQSAVGAIWRSKRSVVFGDPLQLEPIGTIPLTVQEALRKYYQVAEVWIPGTTSVQRLADRVSRLGTYVNDGEDHIWVGSPLRVHRRCDQPMFDISNKMAYDGLMVLGTPDRPKLDILPSGWVDVKSNKSEGHWIPAEGQALERLLADLIKNGIQPDKIFLISPFRDVVKQLRQIAKRFGVKKTGTIHTV